MVLTDVVESILIRCDATVLLRCKTVCKPWGEMISTPAFTRTHANFVSTKVESNSNRKIALLSSFPTNLPEPTYSSPLPGDYYRKWQMGGSCNGLVCLYAQKENQLIVSNPVTRLFRVIQPPAISDIKEMRCLGFGYDASTDDYKVVTAICQHNGHHALVYILSLKSNIWRDYGKVDYRFDDFVLARPGILYKGALHWFWLDPTDTSRLNILLVSFDLAKEEFRVIPQPHDTRYVWNYRYKLGLINGHLCIFTTTSPSCGIWVMITYNSWELVPNEIQDHAIHYMLRDTNDHRMTPPPGYHCDDNIKLSRSKGHLPSPMFVQTLVSPYAANCSVQSMNGKYLCNRQITGSYAYKKDTKGEPNGTPAERTLAGSNPMAVSPPQVSTVPAIRPPPPPAHLYQPMQMAVTAPQCQQQLMPPQQTPPPSFPPPPAANMPQTMSRPPPPPAGMAGQQMWRPASPQQQMAGRHGPQG